MPVLYKSCRGCGKQIRREYTYCFDCSKEISKMRNKAYDRTLRNQEADKFYHSPEWIKTRNIVINQNPFCIECEAPADVVDHIVELKDGGEPLMLSNLQSLCHRCHARKTAKQKSLRL